MDPNSQQNQFGAQPAADPNALGQVPAAPAPAPTPAPSAFPAMPAAGGVVPGPMPAAPAPMPMGPAPMPMGPNALPMQPMSANSKSPFGKMGGGKKKIIILVAALLVVGGAIALGLMYMSKTKFGALETATYNGLSFKKPKNWKEPAKKDSDQKFYTPNGDSLDTSYAGMSVAYEKFGALASATDEQKKQFISAFKAQLTDSYLRLQLTSSDCTSPNIDKKEDVSGYQNALFAMKIQASCKGKDSKSKTLAAMVVVTNNGGVAVADVAAFTDVFNKNKSAIDEILNSLSDK